MKQAISMLPMYLQHSHPDNLKDIPTSEKRELKNNDKFIRNIVGSTMEAMASASSETKADAQARGRTAQKLWFDEIAYISYNGTIMDAAYPTFVTASANAKKYGTPYGVSITTTPGNLNNEAGIYAYKFMNNCIKFDERMYDMYENNYKQLYKMIEKSTDKNGFIFIQFQYYELGFSDEWYINATKSLDPVKARREYLLEWINSSGLCPFDIDDIDLLIDMARERERTSKQVKITKQWYFIKYGKYEGKLPTLVSCDISTGIGRDYFSIVAVNPETLHPIGIFKSNHISTPMFKKVLVKMILDHFPYSIITIENNSIGQPLIEDLLETPIGRMIYREKKVRNIDMGVNQMGRKRRQEGYAYGHTVTVDSRAKMTNILENLVRYNKSKLAYPELVEEVKFMEFRQGKIQHSPATHDDVTFGYLGALYIVKYGSGMKGRGITFNIAEDYDESIEFNETDDIISGVAATLRRHNVKYFDDDITTSDELEDFFNTPSFTMADVYKAQSDEYRKHQDKILGYEEDNFFDGESITSIPKYIQNSILKAGRPKTSELEDDIMSRVLRSTYKDDEDEYFDPRSWIQ